MDGRDDVCQCCDSNCHKSSPDWNNKTHLRRLIPEGLLNLLSFISVNLLFHPTNIFIHCFRYHGLWHCDSRPSHDSPKQIGNEQKTGQHQICHFNFVAW